MKRIEIMSEVIILDEVREFLEEQPRWSETGINLELKKPNKKYRLGTDPTVLVAIVSATGVGLAALIQGLLAYAEQKGRDGIELESGNKKVKLPASTPFDEVEKYWTIVEESERKAVEKSEIEKIIIP